MYIVFSLLVLRAGLWDLIVSVPDHCLSFSFFKNIQAAFHRNRMKNNNFIEVLKIYPARTLSSNLISSDRKKCSRLSKANLRIKYGDMLATHIKFMVVKYVKRDIITVMAGMVLNHVLRY